MNHQISKYFSKQNIIIAISVIVIVLIITTIYSLIKINSLSTDINSLSLNINSLNTQLASTTNDLQNAINNTHNTLSDALNNEQNRVGTIQQQLGTFQNQVGNISGTVNDLQKLSALDPELLKKYSKVYFLSENYVPAHLTEIPNTYRYNDAKPLLFQTNSLPYLENMINNASSSGVIVYAFSAYRSFDEQKALKTDYAMTYGAGTANSFSADQGYSEHQLGTAVDLMTTGLGGVLDERFDKTSAYTWLLANAYKYGFELSYPKSNSYYVYEPWHWRFVGVKLATYLHNNNLNFYDIDQRTIDTYLVNIFD